MPRLIETESRTGAVVAAVNHLLAGGGPALMARTLEYRVGRDELSALVALVDGLLVAVCAPVRPLPLLRAHGILRAQVEHALARAS